MSPRDFEILANSIRPDIIRAVRPLLNNNSDAAQDIAQDTMLKLWNLRNELDAYKSVKALAITIARRLAINLLRDTRPCDSLDVNTAAPATPSPEDELISRQTADYVDKVLGALPDPLATLIRLRHIEGYDNATIAAMLGSTDAAVRTALSRARQRVARIFQSSGNL